MRPSSTKSQPGSARDVAVFDFGGVLTHPVHSSIEAWMRTDRIVPASLTDLLRAWLSRGAEPNNPLHRLERGEIDEAEFSAHMAAALRTTDGSRIEPGGLLQRFFGGLEMEPVMLDVVCQLRASGVRTVLLSNSWGTDYPWDLIDELFDLTVISSHVGMRKPDEDIYRFTAMRAGVTLAELVFVDDGAPNIERARELGMTAHLHTDATTTQTFLRAAFPSAFSQRS